jgi:hypothetical protein
VKFVCLTFTFSIPVPVTATAINLVFSSFGVARSGCVVM